MNYVVIQDAETGKYVVCRKVSEQNGISVYQMETRLVYERVQDAVRGAVDTQKTDTEVVI